MKKYTSVFVCLVLSMYQLSAQAMGPSTGGGGFVMDCPATPVEPASVLMLDLFEGEEFFRFQMAKASNSIEQDYFQSVKRTYELQGHPELAETLKEDISKNLKRFFRITRFVESSNELPLADDLGGVANIPSQCMLRQVAYFDDLTETVYISKPIWNKMDSLSQAALVQHETAFRDYRKFGDKNSTLSRAVVAHMFSTSGVINLLDGISVQSKRYYTEEEHPTVFVVTNGYLLEPTIRIQFEHIAGYAILAKTWVDVPAKPWNLVSKSLSTTPYQMCVVNTENVNQVLVLPIKGTMSNGLSLKYEYVTGQPIRLSVLRQDGTLIAESIVSAGSDCSGFKIK